MTYILLNGKEDSATLIKVSKIQALATAQSGEGTDILVGGTTIYVTEDLEIVAELLEAVESGMSALMNNGQIIAGYKNGRPSWLRSEEVTHDL